MGPCQDPDYVADPGEGLRHDRGCVVDLTLIDGNGEELLMLQTSRTPARGPDTTTKDLSEGATRNRDLLREVIKSHGFVALET